MKTSFFQKIILAVIIVSLISGPLGNIFIPKALAQAATPGAAVGQALAAGAACFLETKLESFLAGFASRGAAKIEDAANRLVLDGVPVAIIAGGGAAVGMSIETSNALAQSKNCIRDVVVKMIIDWLVDETINWIQGGGQPRYVTNWDTFLSDAFNVGVGEIINESNLRFLCDPFGLQVKIALLPVARFGDRIKCTFDDIRANLEDFYNDFRTGGWIAYEEAWRPQNNYYGASLMAVGEAIAGGEKKKEAEEKKAVTGQGFLPVEKCIDPPGETDPQKCKTYEITTPASIVGHLTQRVAAADLDWAMNVQSWVVSLTNAVINRIIKEGIGRMRTPSKSADLSASYNPYGDYDSALSLKEQERNRIKNEYQNYLTYFEGILNNKNNSSSTVNQYIKILESKAGCVAFVATNYHINIPDIDTARNEASRLANDISYYQGIIDKIESNIIEANNISLNFPDKEMTPLIQKYKDFLNKYQSLLMEISSGSKTTQKSSEEELIKKQDDLAWANKC